MALTIKIRNSAIADKRPGSADLIPGELALNLNALSNGLFFENASGSIIKVGPAAVGPAAPNIAPVGSAGNSIGEFWYNTADANLYIWTGTAWATAGGGGSAPLATTAVPGIVQLATLGETQLGTDTTKVITPADAASTYIQRNFLTTKGTLVGSSATNTPISIPVGTDGQILTACALTLSGVAWAAPPLPGIPCACIIEKGSLITGTAANTPIALPLGVTAQYLRVNTDCATGLEWATGLGDTPVGTINWFAATTAPSGWLVADGRPVSRSTYSTLFSYIGTTYGTGDGSTTFNLPDLRGQFIRGWDSAGGNARGFDPARVFGSSQGPTQVWNGIDVFVGAGGVRSGGEQPVAGGRPDQGHSRSSSTPNTGLTGSQGVRPTNIALLPCIKWEVTTQPAGPSACGIPCACLVSKGSLVTATAAGAPVALPVGTNGQILRANSDCTGGLEWSSAGGSVSALVARGVAVCMDNLKVSFPASGARALQVGVITGTAPVIISSNFCQDGTQLIRRDVLTLTTTLAYVGGGWDFSVDGFVQGAFIHYGSPATAAYCVTLSGNLTTNVNVLSITRIV